MAQIRRRGVDRIIGHYDVVFYGNTGQGSMGIFAGPNPDTDKIADGIGASLNNAEQIAFLEALPDGTTAVLRADPVATSKPTTQNRRR